MGGRLQSEFSPFLLLSIYIKLVSFQPFNLQLGCGIPVFSNTKPIMCKAYPESLPGKTPPVNKVPCSIVHRKMSIQQTSGYKSL